MGIKIKVSHGETKTTCPKCSASRKDPRDKCLSVNVSEGIWNCHNCGWHGTAKKNEKQYVSPPPPSPNLSEKVIGYFKERGVSGNTLMRYKISDGKVYMPQVEEEVNAIMFGYYVNGKLVNIKYRDARKNFKMVSGAQLCPYGLDVALDNSSTEILICEGEVDCLSFYEAGIKIAVSVPNGASKGSQKLDWLSEFWHYFVDKRVYLATDSDEPGVALRDELARRLGKHNCFVVEFPLKDANEVLVTKGSLALVDCFNSAKPYPVEGVDDAVTVGKEIERLYDDGTPKGCYAYDEEFTWHSGHVTVVTGIPGHGKTTYVKNVMMSLAERYGWKFLIYSAEEANAAYALADMYQIYTGKSFFHGDRLTKEQITSLAPFMSNHFKYYSLSENDLTVEAILEKARHMLLSNGINCIVIDNMSTVEKSMSNQSDTRHNQIKSMMSDISRFARANGIHMIIVVHPKKVSKLNGAYEVPKGYDIADSSNWFNFPDNGISVYRNYETGQTEIHRWKVRFWYTGKTGVSYMRFDPTCSRFYLDKKVNDGTDKTKFVGQPYEDYTKLSNPF